MLFQYAENQITWLATVDIDDWWQRHCLYQFIGPLAPRAHVMPRHWAIFRDGVCPGRLKWPTEHRGHGGRTPGNEVPAFHVISLLGYTPASLLPVRRRCFMAGRLEGATKGFGATGVSTILPATKRNLVVMLASLLKADGHRTSRLLSPAATRGQWESDAGKRRPRTDPWLHWRIHSPSSSVASKWSWWESNPLSPPQLHRRALRLPPSL